LTRYTVMLVVILPALIDKDGYGFW